MQSRSLVSMFALIVILGAFIYFFEKDLPSTDELAVQEKQLVRFEADAVESIDIVRGDSRVSLQRREPEAEDAADQPSTSGDETDWRMIEPFDARADQEAIRRLLESVTNLEIKRKIEDFSAAELGLDEPVIRVEFGLGSQVSTLDVGFDVPGSSDVIVSNSGSETTARVAGDFVEDLEKEPGAWRARDLFHGSRAHISRISLERTAPPESRVVLGKRESDFWIEEPLLDRAEENSVENLLTALTSLEAKSFVDEPLLDMEALGLQSPSARISVEFEDGTPPFGLELGLPTSEEGQERYAQVGDQVVILSIGLTESLSKTANQWRSLSLTNSRVFELEKATLTSEQETLTISRQGSDWQRGDVPIDYSTVSDLLYPLVELEAQGFLATESATRALQLKVELFDSSGQQTLELFELEDGKIGASVSTRDTLFELAREDLDNLMVKLEEVSKAEPVRDQSATSTEESGEPAADVN